VTLWVTCGVHWPKPRLSNNHVPDQMIRRHHLVVIKRIKELALTPPSPPHHRPLPRIAILIHAITVQQQSQREFCNTIGGEADIAPTSQIGR
jgi:hypothetical protein